jgi:hypothetical protein
MFVIHLNVNQVQNDVQTDVSDYKMVQQCVKMLNDLRFVIEIMLKMIYPTKLKDLRKQTNVFIFDKNINYYLVIIDIVVDLFQLNSLIHHNQLYNH